MTPGAIDFTLTRELLEYLDRSREEQAVYATPQETLAFVEGAFHELRSEVYFRKDNYESEAERRRWMEVRAMVLAAECLRLAELARG